MVPASSARHGSAISALRDIEDALAVADVPDESMPLPLAPNFSEVVADLRGVLSVPEIARATGVKERQVHHWLAGTHSPKGAARDQLLSLFQIVRELQVALSEERIRVWLSSPQPDLQATPLDSLNEGRDREVLDAARGFALRTDVDDVRLIELARSGNVNAYDALVRRYRGFVRLKASSYSLLDDSDSDDLIQEGLLGLYKAIRDYRPDRESSFRSFAELCITRQLIQAVKTAARHKGRRAGRSSEQSSQPGREMRTEGPSGQARGLIDGQQLEDLVSMLAGASGVLSDTESRVLSIYLDGAAPESIARHLGWEVEEVGSALQRVKRKVGAHIAAQEASSQRKTPLPD